MKMLTRVKGVTKWVLVLAMSAKAFAAEPADEAGLHVDPARLQAWSDSRLGLFVHWGPWSQTGIGYIWKIVEAMPQEERERYFEQLRPRLAALTPELSRRDSERYLDTLVSLPGVDAASPVGVVGYCMGVRLALRAAGDRPTEVGAVAGLHGGDLVTDAPDSPHLSLASLRAAVLLRHADEDPSMSPEAMATIAETAREHGVYLDQDVYAGAHHGYSMADTSVYDESAAERHFEELRSHLDRHLKA